MKVWFVLEANNIDTDIWISDPFYSEESAQEYLKERYYENINIVGENIIEDLHFGRKSEYYSILTYGSDYYYGVVRSVDIDKFVTKPGDKLYFMQEVTL